MAAEHKNADTVVLVTGANGFVASHLVEQLLAKGYTVRGTVRSLADEKKTAHLTRMPGAAERLKLLEASLTEPGSFDEVRTALRLVQKRAQSGRGASGRVGVVRHAHCSATGLTGPSLGRRRVAERTT
jgi:nucleoside-diphosphate-sugar epimerase